jgi:hypothetical protein
MSKPLASGLTLPATLPPPPSWPDLSLIRGCDYGKFPWDDWERRALAAGLMPGLAGRGRLLMREAFNHGWSASLCIRCGWRDDGRELLAFALRDPGAARRQWHILMRTDGLRGDIPPGSLDWKWEYLRPDARDLRAELESRS